MSSLQQKNTCFPGFSTSAHPFYYPFRYEKKSTISYFRQNLTTAFPGVKIRNDFSNMYIFSFWIIAEINGLNFFVCYFYSAQRVHPQEFESVWIFYILFLKVWATGSLQIFANSENHHFGGVRNFFLLVWTGEEKVRYNFRSLNPKFKKMCAAIVLTLIPPASIWSLIPPAVAPKTLQSFAPF